jgi:nucleoid-associated protein YgaU
MSETHKRGHINPNQQTWQRDHLSLVTADNKHEHVRLTTEDRILRTVSQEARKYTPWQKAIAWMLGTALAAGVGYRLVEGGNQNERNGMPLIARDYTIKDGDTAWGLAHRFAPDEDPRPIVDAITKQDADLQIGDHIKVPGLSYTIKPGDTAWGIAEQYTDGDPRSLVDAIEHSVHDQVLQPGQVIIVRAEDL